MHFHLPKPMHGWRQFAGEVGIIVIGVLIALGAEQAVEAAHWRSVVAEFREAADTEFAYNLAAYKYRIDQEGCVQRNLSDLARWRDLARAGRVVPLRREIGRPSVTVLGADVWSARGDAFLHMPLSVRVAYSQLSGNLENGWQTIEAEREVWRSLAAFNGVSALSPDALMRLNELLYRAKSLDWVMRTNWPEIQKRARSASLRPDFGNRPATPADPSFCDPLLPASVIAKGD